MNSSENTTQQVQKTLSISDLISGDVPEPTEYPWGGSFSDQLKFLSKIMPEELPKHQKRFVDYLTLLEPNHPLITIDYLKLMKSFKEMTKDKNYKLSSSTVGKTMIVIDSLGNLADELKDKITPAQRLAFRENGPCLIPPNIE